MVEESILLTARALGRPQAKAYHDQGERPHAQAEICRRCLFSPCSSECLITSKSHAAPAKLFNAATTQIRDTQFQLRLFDYRTHTNESPKAACAKRRLTSDTILHRRLINSQSGAKAPVAISQKLAAPLRCSTQAPAQPSAFLATGALDCTHNAWRRRSHLVILTEAVLHKHLACFHMLGPNGLKTPDNPPDSRNPKQTDKSSDSLGTRQNQKTTWKPLGNR